MKNANKKKKSTSSPESISTDPLGMYTGVPENRFETPIQDADDL